MTIVDFHKFTSGENLVLSQLAHNITSLVQIAESISICLQPLWRHQQYILSIQMEEIRTLPHIALFLKILGLGKYGYPLPINQILGSKEQSPSQLILSLTAQNHVEGISLFPNLWITEMLGIVCWHSENWITFVFGKMYAILAISQILILIKGLIVIWLKIMMTGVNQPQLAIMLNGTAREAAAFHITWNQSCWQSLPMNHILAAGVPPMHRAPLCCIWIILIKHMIITLKIGKTIWIINPTTFWHQMIAQTIPLICYLHFFFHQNTPIFLRTYYLEPV